MRKNIFILTLIICTFALIVDAQEYVVKNGDILRISVWGEEDLDKELTVTGKGEISYPLIGRIKVTGLTVQEVDDKITELLEKDYFVNPDVSVTMSVVQFFITGEVKKPGAYPILGNITPIQAVSLAGGFTDFASHTLRIIRKSEGKTETIKINTDAIPAEEMEVGEEYIMRPNDVIIVPRSFF